MLETANESVFNGLIFANGDDRLNYICGRIKSTLGGKIDGGELRNIIEKKL